MRCAVHTNNAQTELLLGGDMNALQLFDLVRFQTVKEVQTRQRVFTATFSKEKRGVTLEPWPQ